jgi:hypothetical protein
VTNVGGRGIQVDGEVVGMVQLEDDLQAILDKLVVKLAHWKARLLTKEGRIAYVQMIMAASVVY